MPVEEGRLPGIVSVVLAGKVFWKWPNQKIKPIHRRVHFHIFFNPKCIVSVAAVVPVLQAGTY